LNIGQLTDVLRCNLQQHFPCNRQQGKHMGEDLMTRRQVASVFGVTSAAVATWARRGRLPEVRNEDGRPRYRRADVQALARNGASVRRHDRAAALGSLCTEDAAGRRSSR
jgi:MerR HTH family regulatory protein